MLNDVYNEKILELAGNIPRLGRLSAPDASARAHSKLCGSTVTVDLKLDGDTVADFAHDVKACALGQASSSLMARHIIGAKADELRELRETMRKMLKENGPPPAGKWADFAVLEPVRDYKARHASTMLTFDAVVQALDEIQAKRAQAARIARYFAATAPPSWSSERSARSPRPLRQVAASCGRLWWAPALPIRMPVTRPVLRVSTIIEWSPGPAKASITRAGTAASA